MVNYTSLQQYPLADGLIPRASHFMCAEDAENRLIGESFPMYGPGFLTYENSVNFRHDFWFEQISKIRYPPTSIKFQNPRSMTRMRGGRNWTRLSGGIIDTFAKLLVLNILHESFYLQRNDFAEALERPQSLHAQGHIPTHLGVVLALFKPKLRFGSKEALKRDEREIILHNVNKFVASITFVMNALKSDHGNASHPLDLKPSYARLQELKYLCAKRQTNAENAFHSFNRQLEYRSKIQSIREADSIKLLTIFAAVNLPLSLSVSYFARNAVPVYEDRDYERACCTQHQSAL